MMYNIESFRGQRELSEFMEKIRSLRENLIFRNLNLREFSEIEVFIMGEIHDVRKMTENRFLNMYEVSATSSKGKSVRYFVASRAEALEDLKLKTGQNKPDGVVIYSVYGENHDKVVLIRQYRYTLGGYVYEFPAGLVDPGEDYHEGAARELYEETGLTLTPLHVDPAYEKPFFTTVGLTDESCATVYGYASGTVSAAAQEDTEEIEVILADRQEVKRILKEERVAIMCAYMLMHFLKDDEPFAFLEESL
jgi:ADP-ribose pyrophosphatase